jgi:hypothetical protein
MWQQQVRQRERAEMVGPELQLEAVRGPLQRLRRDAGVVHQDVDGVLPGRGERPDRGQIREIDGAHLDVASDRGGGLAPRRRVAHGEDDVRPAAADPCRDRPPDSAVPTGDEHRPALQVLVHAANVDTGNISSRRLHPARLRRCPNARSTTAT